MTSEERIMKIKEDKCNKLETNSNRKYYAVRFIRHYFDFGSHSGRSYTDFDVPVRARCPSKLLSPWDTVLKKAGSVLFGICTPGTRTFLSPITSLDIYIPGWCYGCV